MTSIISGNDWQIQTPVQSAYEDWTIKLACVSNGVRVDKTITATDGYWIGTLTPADTEKLQTRADIEIFAEQTDADDNVIKRRTIYRQHAIPIETSLSDSRIVREEISDTQKEFDACCEALANRRDDSAVNISGDFGSISFESRAALQTHIDLLRRRLYTEREATARRDADVSNRERYTVTFDT